MAKFSFLKNHFFSKIISRIHHVTQVYSYTMFLLLFNVFSFKMFLSMYPFLLQSIIKSIKKMQLRYISREVEVVDHFCAKPRFNKSKTLNIQLNYKPQLKPTSFYRNFELTAISTSKFKNVLIRCSFSFVYYIRFLHVVEQLPSLLINVDHMDW